MSNGEDRFSSTLEGWQSKVTSVAAENAKRATFYNRMHYSIGLPAVVLSSAGGGVAIFASLNVSLPSEALLVAGIITVVAAAFTSALTFLNHAKRAEKALSTVTQLANLEREMEIHLQFPPTERGAKQSLLQDIHNRLTEVSNETDWPIAEVKSDSKGGRSNVWIKADPNIENLIS